MRIFIIGNSHTGRNDLARLFTEIAASTSVAKAAATERISLMVPTCASIEIPRSHSTDAIREN
jgi:hypothetical protein